MPSQDGTAGSRQRRRRALKVILMGLFLGLGIARPGAAAVLECNSADVACLIAAINTANANGEVNTIRLQPGTYTLRAVDNDTDGSNGLPSITSPLTIVGAGAGNTIIEREAAAPEFRLLHVAQTGLLKLEGLTARGGHRFSPSGELGGGGLLNRGTAIISQSALTDNFVQLGATGGQGGGIQSLGRLVIAGSTISGNRSRFIGGGIASSSSAGLTVVNSTISRNTSGLGGGLFIGEGMAIIIGSTIADNSAADCCGGGLFSRSSTAVAIINSTLVGPFSGVGGGVLDAGGGIIVNSTIHRIASGGAPALIAGSALALYNTIVSDASFGPPGFQVCSGPVTSLGNNLFIDPSCAVALLPQDLTGDPRLGDFTDDGTPGQGFMRLLPGSPAINAGADAACLPTDQLGRKRIQSCDIGAIEGTRPLVRHHR